jgi:hypothetical protein
MSRALKVNTSTTPVSLKELSDAELEYVAASIAAPLLSSTSGTLTGELNINGSGFTIGDFTDTRRTGTVGTHAANSTNIISTTSTFKQVLDLVTEDGSTPLALNYNNSLNGLKEEALDVNGSLFNAIINLVDYKLQTAAPTDSGTWTAIGNISDTLSDGTVLTSTLWKRTASAVSAPSGNFRPIKVHNGNSLKELSDSELSELLPFAQNTIVNTQVGQYRYQATAPAGGTWIAAGTAGPGDTIHNIGDVSYTGYYSQGYTGYYSQAYTGFYSTTYSRAFSLNYTRGFGRNFTRSYSGYGRANYTGYYTGTYAGYYTGYFTGTYTGYYSRAYTGYYGASYTGYYTGSTVLAPTGVVANPKTLWKRVA